MMNEKTIVVFYSKSGTTKKVSNNISELKGWDIVEIHDTKNRKGIIGFIIGGRDAMKKKLTTIEKINKNLLEYDKVVIGTPVWASNIPPAIRTFVTEYKDMIKSISTFTTKGGAGEDAVVSEIEAIAGKKSSVNLQLTGKEVKSDVYKVKIQDFVKKI